MNEGTFGVVFKAIRASENANYEDCMARGTVYPQFFAIKKPKNNAREGEGFNKDAVREIALLKELSKHRNIVTLRDVFLNPDPGHSTNAVSRRSHAQRSSSSAAAGQNATLLIPLGRAPCSCGRRQRVVCGLRLGRIRAVRHLHGVGGIPLRNS